MLRGFTGRGLDLGCGSSAGHIVKGRSTSGKPGVAAVWSSLNGTGDPSEQGGIVGVRGKVAPPGVERKRSGPGSRQRRAWRARTSMVAVGPEKGWEWWKSRLWMWEAFLDQGG